jgi:hypothetical protein
MPSALDAAGVFLTSVDRADWKAAASVVDPVWAAEFQAKELGHLVAWCSFRDMKEMDPSLSGFSSNGEASDAVLEQYSSRVIPVLPGKPTISALRSLHPGQFIETYLDGSLNGKFPPDSRHVTIGSLPFDDANEYVLYYWDPPGAPPEWTREGDGIPYARILVVTRRDDRWGVRVGHEFTTLLQLSLGGEDDFPETTA